MRNSVLRWDVFCSVIDNFGDIGICWRLCRQLAAEQDLQVRLWVDDLHSFARICPQINPLLAQQECQNVLVQHWQPSQDWQDIAVADVVIEALACTIPFAYQQKMAAQPKAPLWLNLEYLSAESWVEDCHAMSSPQPQLPLTKYFFFPGFSTKTGGLLREQHLLTTLAQFQHNALAQQAFWQRLGIVDMAMYARKVSLFAYSHQQLASLFECWQQASEATLCVIPEGQLADQAKILMPALTQQALSQDKQLTVLILPFLPQPDYDLLLSACDVNFVRGEDSIIRAQWAAKPFIWQIYRQEEQAHLVKLNAFLAKYTARFSPALRDAIMQFHQHWNTEQNLTASWLQLQALLPELADENVLWRNNLESHGDLASNLVRFVEKKIII